MRDPVSPHSDTLVDPAAESATSLPPNDAVRAVLAGRYELLGMLGAGGMGTVYRARDRELDEHVALKVLRKELATSASMLERFRREVKLARRVTHRNVARTFDIGEHEGDRFLTMELVEGEGLGARLVRLGRLPPSEALAIAGQVCEGLSAAHAAGVVHRDLKPENVVLARDGRVVITDFGIARALQEGEPGRTVGIVGTPAYMAPEQVEGAADLDARADLYALGCMLFELLTGEPPFRGDTVIAIAAARLLKPPPDPRSLVPGLADPVAEVTLRLLARSREDRYASAEEARIALGRAADATTTATGLVMPPVTPPRVAREAARAVAVLPFLVPGSPEDAYLAAGVSDDLVDALSVLPELRVRPRGDTARHDQPTRDAREIGRALGVDVVVDGAVRRAGDQVRVTVRLITVADGFQLWAKRFECAASDVLSVADAAASSVARALTTRDVRTVEGPAVLDPVAQDLYLRARWLLRRGWFELATEAVKLLREAGARVPGDARIAGTLAVALTRLYGAGAGSDDRELVRETRTAVDRALRIDPTQPAAHVARGNLHLYLGETAAAVSALRVALEHAPNDAEALDVLGRILLEADRVEEGRAVIARSLAVDPELILPRVAWARSFALERDWEQAEEVLGPLPAHGGDLATFLLAAARFALWDASGAFLARLEARLASADLSEVPPFARVSAQGILAIARGRAIPPGLEGAIEQGLPLEGPFSARRLAFHAQTRAELYAACGLGDRAIAMLTVADSNALFDVAWLDHCALFDALRSEPEFVRVRNATALRASRVLEADDLAREREAS